MANIIFRQDIVLDESAFNKASSDFDTLGSDLKKLRDEIEDMLEELKEGFDTPAGRKFINSCKKNLIEPLDQQKLVIEHVSQNIRTAKDKYSSVFEDYRSLNSLIKSSAS